MFHPDGPAAAKLRGPKSTVLVVEENVCFSLNNFIHYSANSCQCTVRVTDTISKCLLCPSCRQTEIFVFSCSCSLEKENIVPTIHREPQGRRKHFDIGPANPFLFPSLPFLPSYPLLSFPFRSSRALIFPPLSILPLPSIFASLPSEVGALNPARGSGAEPQRKSNLVHFSIKI